MDIVLLLDREADATAKTMSVSGNETEVPKITR